MDKMFVILFTFFVHCRSLSPCISHFSFSHRPYIIFMFFYQRNWSPLLFIFRYSSFPVFQVNEDIKIWGKERLGLLLLLLLLFFLSKSPGGHVIYLRNERGAWNAKFHLSFNILVPRGADFWLPYPSPRVCTASVRSYADVITKFARMYRLPYCLSYGAPLKRARARSSPKKRNLR